MTEQSSMHLYLNWTKERIDEMDAALASLEVKASQAKADSKEKADEIIADLKKRRDEFQALLKTQAESGEAAWARAKTELDRQWNGFEAPGADLFRRRRQADRAAAGHVQGHRCRASKSLERGGG
jgi:DNA anti-recombination protein RmuC